MKTVSEGKYARRTACRSPSSSHHSSATAAAAPTDPLMPLPGPVGRSVDDSGLSCTRAKIFTDGHRHMRPPCMHRVDPMRDEDDTATGVLLGEGLRDRKVNSVNTAISRSADMREPR